MNSNQLSMPRTKPKLIGFTSKTRKEKMKDRFKFRVFDKNTNKMYDVRSMSYVNGIVKRIEVQEEERILIFDEWQNNIDNTILIQCIGLKDKNGTLIYEGDIVKSDFDFITNTINPLRFNIGNVIYSDYIAGFVIASDIKDYSPYKTAFFGKTEALNCIVIGNIYENRELLNA